MSERLREALRLLVDATGYLRNRHTVVTADLLHARSEAIGALLAEPDVCEWISVEDKLPDFNQVVLAWLVGEENHFEMLWRRHGYAFMVRHDDLNVVLNEWDRRFYDAALVKLGADYAEVTHWMPLPEPPGCGRKIEVKG